MTTTNTYGRQVVVPLTNKSGGGVIAGDVVIIDTTNNDAFTTTTSASFTGVVGIAQETIASNATGRVLMSGYAALVNVPASVTRGHYIFTHTVAKQATGAASRAAGAFGQFLTGGTTPDAHLFGITDSSVSGLSDPMTTRGDVIIRNASNVTARLGIGSTGKVLQSDGTDISWQTPAGGSDLVQTYSGGGSVYIPGLKGSPDIPPGSPSAYDDEFNTTSTFTTALGTLDQNNTSDFPSRLHLKRQLAAVGVVGVYKTAPGMPFTVTAKMDSARLYENNAFAGIMLTEASPGKISTFCPVTNAGTQSWPLYRWTNLTTFATQNLVSTIDPTHFTHDYLRVVVTSSSSVAFSISHDGLVWFTLFSAIDTSMTVANVGLCIGDLGAAHLVEATFDWIRFT
jgi:hypothetical protein